MASNENNDSTLKEIAKSRIEAMRQKLIDLSMNNRELNYNVSNKNKNIRIIHEIPEIICEKLSKGMNIKPLPPLPRRPLDEESIEFINEYRLALLFAEESPEECEDFIKKYIEAMEQASSDNSDTDEFDKIDRELKDDIRKKLNMKSLDKALPSASDWARKNGINPSYELPSTSNSSDNREYQDKNIQTLFFPDEFVRVCEDLTRNYKSSMNETGMNNLRVAIGFLEFTRNKVEDKEKKFYAPILFQEVTLDKFKPKSKGGLPNFRVTSSGDDIDLNKSLELYLSKEHQITIPDFKTFIKDEKVEIDNFLKIFTEAISSKTDWKVKRYMSIGTFSYGKAAMYKDLDSKNWGKSPPEDNKLIQSFYGGTGGESSHVFAEDYDVDEVSLTKGNPSLVTDADASQISTIIDAMDGKNLAVIGPPGTGKSQTITNLIAASINEGKSVLFVAQKMAALEVVEKRLKDIGLGDFNLVMHSRSANKASILESIKKRMNLEKDKYPYNLDEQVEKLKIHTNKLNKYKRFCEKKICSLDFNYHDIVYKYRSTVSEDFPKNIINFKDAKEITTIRLKDLLDDFVSYKESAKKILEHYGQYEKHPLSYIQRKLSVFEVESLSDNLSELKEIVSSIYETEKNICLDFDLNKFDNMDMKIISEIDYALSSSAANDKIEKSLFIKFNKSKFLEQFNQYIDTLNKLKKDDLVLVSKINNIKSESKLLKNLKLIDKKINILSDYGVINKTPNEIKKFQNKVISQNLEYSRNEYFIRNILNIISSRGVQKFDYSKLKIEDLNNSISVVVRAFLELKEDTVNGCREVDIDRDHFLLNKDKIINELMPVVANCEKECKEIKDLRDDLKDKISLSVREDFYEFRKSGQYLMSLKWYDFAEKYREKYKNSIELFQTYSRTQNLPDALEIGNVLYRTSLYMEKQLNVFKDNRLNDNLGKIWKKEDTEFSSLNSYFNFLYEINSIEDIDIRKFIFESIVKLNANSLKEVKKLIFKITNEIPDFSAGSCLVLGYDNIYSLNEFKEKFEIISTEINSIVDLSSEIDFIDFNNSEGFLFSDLENLIDILAFKTKLHRGNNFDLLEEYFISKDDKIKNSKNIFDISDDFKLVAIDTYDFYQACNGLFNKITETYCEKLDLINKIKKKIFSLGFASTLNKINMSTKKLSDASGKQNPIESNISSLLDRDIHNEFLSNNEKLIWIKGILKNIQNNDLSDWLNFIKLRDNFYISGLQDFLDYYNDVKKLNRIDKHFEHYLYRSIAKEFYNDPDNKKIIDYSGLVLDKERDKLDKVDREIKKLNVDKIKSKLLNYPISQGSAGKKVSSYTDNALLIHYKDKTRPFGNMSLRRVILNANSALREYKPCWMMSPYSVAKTLPKISNLFDIIIIDEASQMLPQDAIGSMLRGKQIIIVGDNMQLPPSNLFSVNARSDNDYDTDDESILDQAMISFNPVRRLNWHYRSQHESLIAFSNQEFYENSLTVFPSPRGPSENLGVSYEYIKDAVYHKGTNPLEADEVVDRAIEHMQINKDISLMLVALNKAQAELISQKYETRKDNEYIQDCFEYEDKWASTVEPFVIKNLETVQGDERDSIIISTVYGKEKDSEVVMQRFGPISGVNGHRRLNVLYTRAKKNVRVISSLRPNDIKVTSDSSRGTKAFAGYLEYASTGKLDTGKYTGKEADSPFEISVKDVLENKGYQVECQVGVAGYRIDLGVKHPNWPDGFLAGIECDGATYHRAKSAQDRDVARQKVLEGKGWNIHRIWSTDWFENPHKATEVMIEKLEEWMTKKNLNS